MRKGFEVYDSSLKMTSEEAAEILFPTLKPLSVEEGFEIFKSFFNKPLECCTTLEIEGYPPRHIHGFRAWCKDIATGEELEVTDEVLRRLYMDKLAGEVADEYLW